MKKIKLIIILSYLLFSLSKSIFGQLPTDRGTKNLAIWGFANVDYFLKNHSQFYFEGNLRYSTLPNSNDEIANAFPFFRAHLMLGYEHYFNKNWRVGFSGRQAIEKRQNIFFTRPYIRHVSYLGQGKIEFVKQAAFEFVNYSEELPENNGRFSMYFHLAKNISLGSLNFRPNLSYEFFFIHEWDEADRNPEDTRRVDKTRLRFGWEYIHNMNLYFGFFAMHETDYFIAQEVFNENFELVKPKRNLNLLAPSIGFTVRYVIHPENNPLNRALN